VKNLIVMLVLMLLLVFILLGCGSDGDSSMQTYSGYGITFDYPEGMQLFELVASERDGLIVGMLSDSAQPQEGKLRYFGVEWEPIPSSGAIYLKGILEQKVAAILDEFRNDMGIQNLDIGEIKTKSVNGHDALWQEYSFITQGEEFHGTLSVWDCLEGQYSRIYSVDMGTDDTNVSRILDDFWGSFDCH